MSTFLSLLTGPKFHSHFKFPLSEELIMIHVIDILKVSSKFDNSLFFELSLCNLICSVKICVQMVTLQLVEARQMEIRKMKLKLIELAPISQGCRGRACC